MTTPLYLPGSSGVNFPELRKSEAISSARSRPFSSSSGEPPKNPGITINSAGASAATFRALSGTETRDASSATMTSGARQASGKRPVSFGSSPPCRAWRLTARDGTSSVIELPRRFPFRDTSRDRSVSLPFVVKDLPGAKSFTSLLVISDRHVLFSS